MRCPGQPDGGVEGETWPSEKYLQHWMFLTFIDFSGDSGMSIECECVCILQSVPWKFSYLGLLSPMLAGNIFTKPA